MKTLTQLGDDLQSALEELQVAQKLALMPAMESNGGSSNSNAYRAAALEAEGEAKQNWLQRILAFFRRLYERVKTWFSNRMAANRDKDAGKKVEAYKQAVNKYRQDAKTAGKEAETILQANMDNPRFKQIADLADRTLDAAIKDPQVFASLKFNATSYALYYSLYKDKSKAQQALVMMTKIGQQLDAACEFFARAVDEARQGRGQVRTTVASLVENMQKANNGLEDAREFLEGMMGSVQAPKTVEELLQSVLNFSFFNKLTDVPFIKDAGDSVKEMLEGSEDMMTWFENISNQGTRDSGNALNDRIYDVGAETLNTLALSPAKLIQLVTKIEKLVDSCTPNFSTHLFDSLQAGIRSGIIGKIPTNTPQERTFLNEYLSNTIANKFTTYFVNSGL